MLPENGNRSSPKTQTVVKHRYERLTVNTTTVGVLLSVANNYDRTSKTVRNRPSVIIQNKRRGVEPFLSAAHYTPSPNESAVGTNIGHINMCKCVGTDDDMLL